MKYSAIAIKKAPSWRGVAYYANGISSILAPPENDVLSVYITKGRLPMFEFEFGHGEDLDLLRETVRSFA